MRTWPPAYIHLLESGPLPGRIDTWAAAGRFFKQRRTGVFGRLDDRLKPLRHPHRPKTHGACHDPLT